MANTGELTSLIEYLREKMVVLASEKGNIGNEDVLYVSQRLDLYIVQEQRRMQSRDEDDVPTDAHWTPPIASGSEFPFRFWPVYPLKARLRVVYPSASC